MYLPNLKTPDGPETQLQLARGIASLAAEVTRPNLSTKGLAAVLGQLSLLLHTTATVHGLDLHELTQIYADARARMASPGGEFVTTGDGEIVPPAGYVGPEQDLAQYLRRY